MIRSHAAVWCAVCWWCILFAVDFSPFLCQASGWQSLGAAVFFNNIYAAVKCPVLSPLFEDTYRFCIMYLKQLITKWRLALFLYIYICLYIRSPTFVFSMLYSQWLGPLFVAGPPVSVGWYKFWCAVSTVVWILVTDLGILEGQFWKCFSGTFSLPLPKVSRAALH